jgi:uncharacterized membrane protein
VGIPAVVVGIPAVVVGIPAVVVGIPSPVEDIPAVVEGTPAALGGVFAAAAEPARVAAGRFAGKGQVEGKLLAGMGQVVLAGMCLLVGKQDKHLYKM